MQAAEPAAPQARLRNRALKAGFWTLGGYGAELGTRLISNVILTRLLFPEAFGAIAAAAALMAGLMLISDFGVRAVIVQSPRGDQADFLRSAWVFQLWRGVLLWVVLAVLCALLSVPAVRNLLPAASVFANPSFPLITLVLGFTLVLSGAESTSISLNQRHLNFRPIAIVNLAGRISSLPVMFLWAWLDRSVWALVAGILFGGLIRVILSHLTVPGPAMALKWAKSDFRQITSFGRWIVVSSIATFVSQQCDVIFLGMMIPASELGLYSIAKLLIGSGEGLLDQLNSSLALPVLGEVLRGDPETLRSRYYRFRLPIDVAAGALSGGLFVAGYFIISFLYDPRYAQAGIMLQILALGTLTYPVAVIGSAFTAVGKTHVNAAISILKATSLIVCMTAGYLVFGAIGAVGGVAFHRVIPSIAIVFIARRQAWIEILPELRVLLAFVIGLLCGKFVIVVATALDLKNIHELVRRLQAHV